jgi:hypothetical protein
MYSESDIWAFLAATFIAPSGVCAMGPLNAGGRAHSVIPWQASSNRARHSLFGKERAYKNATNSPAPKPPRHPPVLAVIPSAAAIPAIALLSSILVSLIAVHVVCRPFGFGRGLRVPIDDADEYLSKVVAGSKEHDGALVGGDRAQELLDVLAFLVGRRNVDGKVEGGPIREARELQWGDALSDPLLFLVHFFPLSACRTASTPNAAIILPRKVASSVFAVAKR